MSAPLKTICMIGAFPPPIHGMSYINALMFEKLKASNTNILTIDLSVGSLERTWRRRSKKLYLVCKGILTLLLLRLKKKKLNVYIALSGGYGQLLEIPFVFIARLFSIPIFFHHHSFAYLNKSFWVTNVLSFFTGQSSMHITLCENMAEKLSESYPGWCSKIRTISNAVFINQYNMSIPEKKDSGRLVIGFLGNISFEKGINEYIETLKVINSHENSVFQGLIAGPYQDEIIRKVVAEKLKAIPYIKYAGPVYGEQKKDFFNTIDILLFPTKYINEAEPLTILEAMSCGIPIIASSRGCINCLVNTNSGLVVKHENFINEAVNQLQLWQKNRMALVDASEATGKQFISLKENAELELGRLMGELKT